DVERLFGPRRGGQVAARTDNMRPRRTTPTLTRWLLQAVMTAPQLARRLERSLLDPGDRYAAALAALLDLLAERPDITPQQVAPWAIEHIRDEAVAGVLREVQADLLAAPQVDVEAEFSAALAKVRQHS